MLSAYHHTFDPGPLDTGCFLSHSTDYLFNTRETSWSHFQMACYKQLGCWFSTDLCQSRLKHTECNTTMQFNSFEYNYMSLSVFWNCKTIYIYIYSFFAYLITISSQLCNLFRERGSIEVAMMLQTNHCLLYLSVSFTHLKRSPDSVILMGRELCPFLCGLIWRLLQNGV